MMPSLSGRSRCSPSSLNSVDTVTCVGEPWAVAVGNAKMAAKKRNARIEGRARIRIDPKVAGGLYNMPRDGVEVSWTRRRLNNLQIAWDLVDDSSTPGGPTMKFVTALVPLLLMTAA